MNQDQQHHTYRLSTTLLGAAVLLAVAVLAFAEPVFAQWLNRFTFLGFPAGFYLAAQGSIIVFVVLVFWAARRQESLDRKFGATDDA